MNIEFRTLQSVCNCGYDDGGKLKCITHSCDDKAMHCAENLCPLKAEEIAVRMSNGVIQGLFAGMKTEEKVCRWKHERVEVNAESDYYETHYTRSCGNGIVRQTSPTPYCWDCGGRVVVE